MSDYLTEEKLGVILSKIFTSPVIPQQTFSSCGERRRMDYTIKLNARDIYLMNGILSKCSKLELPKNRNNDITLLIEFDGHTHYTSGKQIKKDNQIGLGSSEWKLVSSEPVVYGLRIPYFVQLDALMTAIFFNTATDFSDGYPHGFIDKKCYLPEQFTSGGESRFLEELKTLPQQVSDQIYISIFNRIKVAKIIDDVVRQELFHKIVRNLYPEQYETYRIVRRLSPDPGKYYKRLPREIYYVAESNALILTLGQGVYTKNRTKEQLRESLAYYEYIMYGQPYDIKLPKEVAEFYTKIGLFND